MSEGQLRELLREHGIDMDLGELPMKGGEHHMRVHVERHVDEAPRRDRGRQPEAQRGRGGERRADRGQDRRSTRDRAGRGDRGRGDRAGRDAAVAWIATAGRAGGDKKGSRQGVGRWTQALDRLDRRRGGTVARNGSEAGERTRMERGWGRDRDPLEDRGRVGESMRCVVRGEKLRREGEPQGRGTTRTGSERGASTTAGTESTKGPSILRR